MKIGTLKICSEWKGQRIGEGALGLALMDWQRSDLDQIYVTVFPKQEQLIGMLRRYGFHDAGTKSNGECVYCKDKTMLDYTGADEAGLMSFPYIDPDFNRGRFIPITANFHDVMFMTSSEFRLEDQTMSAPVSNGFIKSFIATPFDHIDYRPGDLAFIYRIAEKNKSINSRLTGFCTVSKIDWIKSRGKVLHTRDEFGRIVGNKTVYDDPTLDNIYEKPNICVITLIYNGSFSKKSNLNYNWLKDNGFFEDHPYKITLSPEQTLRIIREGGVNESDVVGYKS